MGSKDGLGKFPVVIAVGDTLTREQTNEVMLRTTSWYHLTCNDEAWDDMVIHILGLADKLNDSLVELPDGARIWDCEYQHQLTDGFGNGIDALKLYALDNWGISRRGSGGWLDWSGQIRARYREGSKWTSIEEVEADWQAIAAAFPFLRIRAQLAAGDYLNVFDDGSPGVPAGQVGAEWIINHGEVHRVDKPGKPLIGPERWWQKPRDDWYQFPWWHWKIATPITSLYYWQHRRRRAAWPHIGPWSLAMHWEERGVCAPRLIEAVDQMKEAHMPDLFTVTEQHLKLLRHANLRWEDSYQGAPGIDAKMPYGSKWVFHDIAEILDPDGFGAVPEGDDAALGAYEQEHEDEFLQIHFETIQALGIALRTGEFKTGVYRRSDVWASDWTYVGPEEVSV